jgi:glycosyltransferase involved in cell wall biosynthesis
MLTDIFITTCGRPELFSQSFQSLLDNTDRKLYRLTLVVDGGQEKGTNYALFDKADHVLWHNASLGLGPSINQALSHINNLNLYYDNNKSNFICMCQDDILYANEWLEKLLKVHNLFSRTKKLGFATGHLAPEHKEKTEIKFGNETLYFKPWIRATQMLAPADYWMSMYPISRIDPETGRERARPHGGMGSSVDWWLVRDHPNSVCNSGRTNIVYPGLIKHIGYKESTWLDRELPEIK